MKADKTIKSRPLGNFFEDLEVGKIYRHWPGKTIFEADNSLFSLLTMNHHPLHIDYNYSKETDFGQILVCGPLVISTVIGMSVSDISGEAIANLGYEKILHNSPVFVGDTIYAATEIISKRISKSKPDRGIVKVESKAYNQNQEKVLTLRREVLLPVRNNDKY